MYITFQLPSQRKETVREGCYFDWNDFDLWGLSLITSLAERHFRLGAGIATNDPESDEHKAAKSERARLEKIFDVGL